MTLFSYCEILHNVPVVDVMKDWSKSRERDYKILPKKQRQTLTFSQFYNYIQSSNAKPSKKKAWKSALYRLAKRMYNIESSDNRKLSEHRIADIIS